MFSHLIMYAREEAIFSVFFVDFPLVSLARIFTLRHFFDIRVIGRDFGQIRKF